MVKSIQERKKYISKKIADENRLLKEYKKHVQNIQRFKKKNPAKKELWVPYMGMVNVNTQIAFGKKKVLAQKNEVARWKDKLKRLERLG